MKREQTSPYFIRNKLLKNKEAYVESVGKADIGTLSDVADAPDGKGTVLRLILGATICMPFRALTYAQAAIRCAKLMPFEQLQIIHANEVGQIVNGIPLSLTHEESGLFAQETKRHIRRTSPELEDKILHASDVYSEPTFGSIGDTVEQVFGDNPELGAILSRKGEKHGGDSIAYAAAHVVFQDTDRLELSPLLANSVDQVKAERIVSIGCLQERNFYLARMAVRELVDLPDQLNTAQIFTRHVSPPYFRARGGEPSLREACASGFTLTEVSDLAAARDLRHFYEDIPKEEQ